MSEFDWLIRGVIVIAIGALGWVIKTFATKLLDKLDEVVESNNNVSRQVIAQGGQIKSLEQRVESHDERINKHGDRIRTVEIEIAKKSQ